MRSIAQVLFMLLVLTACSASPRGTPTAVDKKILQWEEPVKKRDITGIRSVFHNAGVGVLDKTKWRELGPGYFEKGVLAAYDTLHDQILYSRKSLDKVIIHEALHAYFEKGKVLSKEDFTLDVKISILGAKGFVAFKKIFHLIHTLVRKCYPATEYETEVYAYLGTTLYTSPDYPVPVNVLKHYRGVLHANYLKGHQ